MEVYGYPQDENAKKDDACRIVTSRQFIGREDGDGDSQPGDDVGMHPWLTSTAVPKGNHGVFPSDWLRSTCTTTPKAAWRSKSPWRRYLKPHAGALSERQQRPYRDQRENDVGPHRLHGREWHLSGTSDLTGV